jgi:hypothetical protein
VNPRGPAGIPLRLLVLDGIGTLLLALGLIELFNAGNGLFDNSTPFPGHDWALIVTGLLIMLPAMTGITRHLLQNRKRP